MLHPLIDQIRFRYTVNKMHPALIHLNPSLGFKSFIRDGLFALQAKQLGYPLLIFWHGWAKDFETVVEKNLLGFFTRTFAKADSFIVLASEFEQKLREWGVTVPIHRGTTNVDESLLAGVDVQAKWTDSARLSQIKILFLARLERAKGVFETVEAIKSLMNKKFPVYLTIAGDGRIRKELEEYTRSLNLTPQDVRFTGDIRGADKIRAFSEHHIYCFPTSYGEGLPTSVLEAMAFGMPVVTTSVGGLKDIFKNGKMGFFTKSTAPEHIAQQLEKLINNPKLMKQISEYNYQYAQQHFMSSKVAERIADIYSQVL